MTATIEKIRIPHLFTPREYQYSIMGAVPALKKRGVFVYHRRAGKDRSAWNKIISEAVKTKAIYYYFFPTYRHGRKVIWDGIDAATGLKFLDHIPAELLAKKNDTEMKITLTNGSIIQIVGTDDFDSIMGTNPLGCVFSEFSLQDPRAWDYIRPILRENGGWAIFVFTFRGRNHGWQMYEMAKNNDDWFAELLTVRDTKREDGTPVITEDDIDHDRREGMDEALIQQEYYCSPDGYIQGSYYSRQIQQARKDGRITSVPHVAGQEVYTFWDLGIDDSMTIWFMQQVGKELRFIDYYENSGEGLAHYAKHLKSLPYVFAEHIMPHDADTREIGTGKSRRETAEELGIRTVRVVQRARNMDVVLSHIEQARNKFSECFFDEKKCARGLSALEGYHSEYDEEKKILSNRPYHDWTSHGADAFRTFAVGFETKVPDEPVTTLMATMSLGRGWNGG
jgi:hypothetical protein